MARRLWMTLLIGLLFGMSLTGCGRSTNPESTNQLQVAVSILPQRYGCMQNLGGQECQDFGSLRERYAQGFKIVLLGII